VTPFLKVVGGEKTASNNYSALKNSIFRVINSSSKTKVCFLTIGPADKLLNAAHLIFMFFSF